MGKEQLPAYAGKLAAFDDPVLDALACTPKLRVTKEIEPQKTRCPGCGKVALLTKRHYATICEECHQDISERARRPYA